MTPKSKQFGHLIISVIASISILVVAYFEVGPENAWLYLIAVWSVLFAAFELYSNLNNKSRR